MHLLINDNDAPIVEQVNLPILEAVRLRSGPRNLLTRINCAEVNFRDDQTWCWRGPCKKYRLGLLNIG